MGSGAVDMQFRPSFWIVVCMIIACSFCPAHASRISPVTSDFGMVVAGHPEAAEIGAVVLRQGGNAIDAVVATGFALGVAEPYGSGIGGKCVILYYDSAAGKTWFVDGMDASGARLDVQKMVAASSQERAEGALGVGVPGMVAAMDLAHEKWGSMPWENLLQPSIDLARDGFLVAPGMRVFFEHRVERIQSHPECARLYMPGGHIPDEGSRLANPDLAKTMQDIAQKGMAGFYDGEVAGRIVGELQSGGSILCIEDFRKYAARIWEPISIDYGDYTVVSGGRPTSGGATALLTLKLLEKQSWPDENQLVTPANLDLWGRSLRHVYPLIQASIADTEDMRTRWEIISSEPGIERLKQAVSSSITEDVRRVAPESAMTNASGWTTHFVVADKFGNVASVTQSLSHHFGSGVVAAGTGVVLNNSLNNFSFTDPEEVNYVGPDKRPRSTIAPAIVFKAGHPVLAIGLPGGGRIPTTLSALLIDYLQFGANIGESMAVRRFHLLRSWSKDPDSNVFQMELGTDENFMQALAGFGWDVQEITDAEIFGGVTAIEIGRNGSFTGWADFRRTNWAAGVKEE